MGVKIVCSDMHFGDRDCSLYSEKISRSLWRFWAELGKIDELILAGDILDANLSTLTRAIEGKKSRAAWPRQIGLKGWLDQMLKTGNLAIDRIVYIPGNHDYVIFDYLAIEKAFLSPLSKGEDILKGLPIIRDVFENPFIRGVAPKSIRDRFIVYYPDYGFTMNSRNILITHGHYLDNKQTLFKSLKKRIAETGGNERKAMRDFFIATAQYQTIARAASYMRSTRELIEGFYKPLDRFFGVMEKTIDYISKLRNCPIDGRMLLAIEMYVKYFREAQTSVPDIFIFGHTHEAGRAFTRDRRYQKTFRPVKKNITVYNTGSFLKKSEIVGSFLVIDDSQEHAKLTKIYDIDAKGRIKGVTV